MKKSILLMLILLFFTACGGNTAEPELSPAVEEAAEIDSTGQAIPTNEPAGTSADAEQAAIPATLTAVPTSVPAVVIVGNEPASTPAGDSATAEAVPPTEPAPPTAEVVMDGQNPDGSFYRGLATAPITMIDYSDFL